jgi:hypothetical protein
MRNWAKSAFVSRGLEAKGDVLKEAMEEMQSSKYFKSWSYTHPGPRSGYSTGRKRGSSPSILTPISNSREMSQETDSLERGEREAPGREVNMSNFDVST